MELNAAGEEIGMPWWGWLIIAILTGVIVAGVAYAIHFLAHFLDGF